MAIKITSEKLTTLIERANEGRLVLPNFQREYTYSKKDQKRLLESLFCGIPIGTVLTMEGTAADFNHRLIGRKSIKGFGDDKGEKVFLLDGQQRLTTLWNAFTDIYSGKSEDDKNELRSNVHNNLHSRWFLKFRKSDDFDNDIWGLRTFSLKEIRANLLPDELDEFLVYDVKKIDSIFWSGDSLELPKPNAKTQGAKEYRDLIRNERLLPIHLLFDNNFTRVLNIIANDRESEIAEEVESIHDDLKQGKANVSEEEILFALECTACNTKEEFLDSDKDSRKDLIEERKSAWISNIMTFLSAAVNTEVGVTELGKSDLNKSHVIFNVINKSGIALSTFDLFCATKSGFDVRNEIYKCLDDYDDLASFGLVDKNTQLLTPKFTNQIINVLKVVLAREYDSWSGSLLKEDERLFKLDTDSLKMFFEDAVVALLKAYQLAHRDCGVQTIDRLPYDLRILPIALLYYNKMEGESGTRAKYFYWLSLFSGIYRESQNTRCFEQLDIVNNLTENAGLPSDYQVGGRFFNKILSVPEYNDLESTAPIKGRIEARKAVDSSLLQWVLAKKPVDFPGSKKHEAAESSGESVVAPPQKLSSETQALEKHHILPLGNNTIKESGRAIRKEKGHYLNSPLNLTYISKLSNRAIGAMKFEEYSKQFAVDVRRTHCLPEYKFDKDASANQREKSNRAWLRERHQRVQQDIKNTLQIWHEVFSSDS